MFFAYRKRDSNPRVRIMIPLFYPTKLFRHADYDPAGAIIYRFLVVGLEFALRPPLASPYLGGYDRIARRKVSGHHEGCKTGLYK